MGMTQAWRHIYALARVSDYWQLPTATRSAAIPPDPGPFLYLAHQLVSLSLEPSLPRENLVG